MATSLFFALNFYLILYSPEPLTTPQDNDHADSPHQAIMKIFHRQRYSSKMSTLSEYSEVPERETSPPATATQHEPLIRRPSLLSVLVGSHLSVYVSEGMCHDQRISSYSPANDYPLYIYFLLAKISC